VEPESDVISNDIEQRADGFRPDLMTKKIFDPPLEQRGSKNI
jgi:hypothetical protein